MNDVGNLSPEGIPEIERCSVGDCHKTLQRDSNDYYVQGVVEIEFVRIDLWSVPN